MNEQPLKEENLLIIKEIETSPAVTQRDISKKLGISLGKTNYLLKELIKKGLIKAKSFSHNPYKLKKIHYILTKDGFEEKLRLTQHFLLKKEAEYNRLKQEWEEISVRLNSSPNPQSTNGGSG
jgi:EPS-associated MarR family transcriptional regulator